MMKRVPQNGQCRFLLHAPLPSARNALNNCILTLLLHYSRQGWHRMKDTVGCLRTILPIKIASKMTVDDHGGPFIRHFDANSTLN